MDCSPPDCSVHATLQARILEWVAMPSSRGSSLPRDQTGNLLHLLHWQAGSLPLAPLYFPWKKMKVKSLSHVQLFATPRTVAYQAPLSMVFSRQEYQRRVPGPSPGDLPHPGKTHPGSPTLQADALPSEPSGNSLGGNKRLRSGFMVSTCDELDHWEISKSLVFFFPPCFVFVCFNFIGEKNTLQC